MNKITVNTDKFIGSIKPINGVGQPPIIGHADFSRFEYLSDASIPYSRLHDVAGYFGGGRFVDIPNIFRDFDADPTDPANYDFAFTDTLITALVNNGVEPFYRLGVTIEVACNVKAYHIYPPKDNLKWAKICEGIIRHYTEGWANGFFYNIKYWEIWNEPEDYIKEDGTHLSWMFLGSKEQFFELYKTAATYLKEKFPHLKIGGYGSVGFYALIDEWAGKYTQEFYLQYFLDFLAFVKENNCPLDFFSWHAYDEIENVQKYAAFAREKLDSIGYTHTESILNEWNCRPMKRGTLEHASCTAASLLAMQDTSIDSAMFYDARCGISMYSSLFNPETLMPYPALEAFNAFGELYRRKNQVQVTMDIEGVYAVSAKSDNGDGCLVIANTNERRRPFTLELTGDERVEYCTVVDRGRIGLKCSLPTHIPAYSILCIYYK